MAWELIFTEISYGRHVHPVRRGDLVHHKRSPEANAHSESDQALVEPKLETPAAIGPLETPKVTTNRVNVAQSFTIRILQPPNDTNRYSLDSEVILDWLQMRGP